MIAFDFDGVISDTYNIFRGHFWDVFGFAIDKENDHYSFDLGLGRSEYYEEWWWREIPVAITKYQHICPPIKESIEAMTALYNSEHCIADENILIITAREPSDAVMQVTKLWCSQNLPFPVDIEFCASSADKFEVIQRRGVTHFIDDRFKTAQVLSPVLEHSYLLNSPWNTGRVEPLNYNVRRVDTIWGMKLHMDALNAYTFGGM
ncbi:MAG: hypothetical protein DRP51_10210 [Candidatus Zixiibacteriota bacterium]|nr:MAG: hypothetical protein DRP51_10210 [candidate division Zixibacteria bacterium]